MKELEKIYIEIYEKYAQHEDIDLSRVITRKMIQDGESSISNKLELNEAIEDIAREWYRVDEQALRYSGISHFPEFEEVEKDELENFIVYKYLRDVEKYQSPLILKVKQAEYEDYTEMMFYDILRLRKENKILIEYTPLNDDTYLVAYNYNGYAKYLEDKIEKENSQMKVEIDLKKATNIYESMLIKVYNEYLVKATDDDYTESVRESITQDLINNEIKDIHSLAPKLKDYLDDCFYIGGLYPYIGLISYDKNNVQEKYDAYAEYNGNLLDEELIDITSEGVSLPLGVNVMYPTDDDENINKLFNELVYKKMQENIKNENDLLEFKIETDDKVYALLISGEIQFNSIDKL